MCTVSVSLRGTVLDTELVLSMFAAAAAAVVAVVESADKREKETDCRCHWTAKHSS